VVEVEAEARTNQRASLDYN